jgi:hypothetical protein
MSVPDFMGPLRTINLNTIGAAGGAAAAGQGPSSGKLPLNISAQTESNWCWAAVSSSVSSFYNAASAWSQCLIANSAFSRNDCCAGGASTTCNQQFYLERALSITQNLKSFLQRSITFAEIQAEIGLRAPVGTRVLWNGGGGHFQAICGWLVGPSGVQYIDVTDPIYLNTQIPFASFASSYQSGATWTHSYLTEPPQASGGAAVASLAIDPTAIGA